MIQKPDIETIHDVITSMDNNLKKLHDSGRVLRTVSFDTVTIGDQGVAFSAPVSSNLVDDFEHAKKKNIKDMTYTSMGMYVCSELSEYQPVEPYYFDYARISQQDPTFVTSNYRSIRGSIPYNPEYYDEIVLNDNVRYLSEHLKTTSTVSSSSESRGISYTKSTAAGRAMAEKNESAYAKSWFYLVILGCACIFSFVAYILYICL